jgi:hypothetical protein
MEEDLPATVDIVMKYGTYEEFLDSQVTRLDLSYLEVRENIQSTMINLT